MKVAVYGYGNLGKGTEIAVKNAPDMSLFGIFTRRKPETVKTLTGAPVFNADEIIKYKDEIDVVVICGGSATDLPVLTPMLARDFNVVDSFDTHAKINEHFSKTNEAAEKGGKVALVSCGWDPGMFSLQRLLSAAVLPDGKDWTFWGKGVSQGHSDAIRRIEGVVDARQYTVPIESALSRVRSGENPELSAREKHLRECYVAVKEGADKARIEKEIKEMPNYFADYETTVNFVSEEELRENHAKLFHGGCVLRSGKTGLESENNHVIEYSLKLDSNPEFTASVLVAYARAVKKIYDRGETGARTVFDIAPRDLVSLSDEELRAHML